MSATLTTSASPSRGQSRKQRTSSGNWQHFCARNWASLQKEKTLITHARSQAAHFLGYEITTMQSDLKQSRTKAGYKRRSINGKVGLRVPRAVVTENGNATSSKANPFIELNCSMRVITPSSQPISSNIGESSMTIGMPTTCIDSTRLNRQWKGR